MVAAGAVGYVFGARAGREQYEKIRQQARKVWSDPRVQEKKDQVQEVAHRKGAEVQEKVQDKVQERMGSADDSGSDVPGRGNAGTRPTAGGVGG